MPALLIVEPSARFKSPLVERFSPLKRNQSDF